MLKDLIRKNRSYRRFDEDIKITIEKLYDFIDLARLSPSARNAQSLRYIVSVDPENNAKIFTTLTWAKDLKDWEGPVQGERPVAYIVMLHDKNISNQYFCDDGIAAQSIMLGAVEAGFGGCIIASVNKPQLKQILQIPDNYEIIQVLALGKPVEEVKIEQVNADGDIKYWRDENQVHHVPKRSLDDLIIESKI